MPMTNAARIVATMTPLFPGTLIHIAGRICSGRRAVADRRLHRFAKETNVRADVPLRRNGTVRQTRPLHDPLGRGVDQLIEAGCDAISFVSPTFKEM
jgi:hypothetical protein